jgi:hypothetical protein
MTQPVIKLVLLLLGDLSVYARTVEPGTAVPARSRSASCRCRMTTTAPTSTCWPTNVSPRSPALLERQAPCGARRKAGQASQRGRCAGDLGRQDPPGATRLLEIVLRGRIPVLALDVRAALLGSAWSARTSSGRWPSASC